MDFEPDISGATLDGAFSRDFHSARTAKPKSVRRRRLIFRVVALTGLGAFAGAVLTHTRDEVVAAPDAAAVQQVRFVADERLPPMMTFSARDEDQPSTHYLARANAATGERRDSLIFGDAESGGLLFRVTLHSAPSPQAKASFFVALAVQSAELGAAVTHATPPTRDESAPTPIEWADITLSDRNGDRACLGFRTTRARNLELSGFACAARGAQLDRAALECLVDRLAPTHQGIDAGLGEILQNDPARRKACARVVG